nr:MAG TPA: hypothetical protein [Caudoviricetes sp.]
MKSHPFNRILAYGRGGVKGVRICPRNRRRRSTAFCTR